MLSFLLIPHTCLLLLWGYSIKSKGIAKDLELNECLVINSKQVKENAVLSSFKYLSQNEERIRRHLEKMIPDYIGKLHGIVEMLNLWIGVFYLHISIKIRFYRYNKNHVKSKSYSILFTSIPTRLKRMMHGGVKGFTEWTNVGKAKPLFRGHYQPRVPADLGYYDLRLPIIREQQAEMARNAGIEGFMYWHYWFGNGKTLMANIFNEVLESGSPDFSLLFRMG